MYKTRMICTIYSISVRSSSNSAAITLQLMANYLLMTEHSQYTTESDTIKRTAAVW